MSPDIGIDKWPLTRLFILLLTLQTPHRDTTRSFRPGACRGLCSDPVATESQRHVGDNWFQHAGKPARTPAPDFTLASFWVPAADSEWVSHCCEPKEPGPRGYFTLKTSCNAAEMQACGIKQLSRRRGILYHLTKMGKQKISSCLSQVISFYFSRVALMFFCFKESGGGMEFCFFPYF